MKRPRWLTKQEVLALHSRAIALYGGTDGLRDEELLESALARPRDHRAYRGASLQAIAAAYADALVGNHPFVDGNKRTAFYVVFVFLGLNGLRLEAPETEVVTMVRGLAQKATSADRFATWLEARSRRRPKAPPARRPGKRRRRR